MARLAAGEFCDVAVVSLVPEAHPPGLLVLRLNIGFEHRSLNPPVATGADFDGGQLAGANQRGGLARRDAEDLRGVGKRQEAPKRSDLYRLRVIHVSIVRELGAEGVACG